MYHINQEIQRRQDHQVLVIDSLLLMYLFRCGPYVNFFTKLTFYLRLIFNVKALLVSLRKKVFCSSTSIEGEMELNQFNISCLAIANIYLTF